jgi:hypothetical protein
VGGAEVASDWQLAFGDWLKAGDLLTEVGSRQGPEAMLWPTANR